MKYKRAIRESNEAFDRYSDELWARFSIRREQVGTDQAMAEHSAAIDYLFDAHLADFSAQFQAWQRGEPVLPHTLDDAMDRIRFDGLLDVRATPSKDAPLPLGNGA